MSVHSGYSTGSSNDDCDKMYDKYMYVQCLMEDIHVPDSCTQYSSDEFSVPILSDVGSDNDEDVCVEADTGCTVDDLFFPCDGIADIGENAEFSGDVTGSYGWSYKPQRCSVTSTRNRIKGTAILASFEHENDDWITDEDFWVDDACESVGSVPEHVRCATYTYRQAFRTITADLRTSEYVVPEDKFVFSHPW